MNQLQTDTTLRVKTCDNVVSVVWEADDLTHTQSSYDKTRPGYLQDNFAQLMAGGMLLGHEQFPLRGRAAHLGVGGGVLARFTCDTLHMQTHGVELSPTMTALARLLFGLREEVQLTQADGMRWIARPECSDAFELIVSHMFLPGTLGPLPATREFCESCRAALNPAEGTLVCNLGSINLGPHKAIADLASVFGAKHGLLLLLQPLHRFSNVIAVASTNRVLDAQRLRQRTHDIERLFVDNGLTATQLQASLLPSLELPPCPSEPTDQGSLPGWQAAGDAATAAARSIAGSHSPIPLHSSRAAAWQAATRGPATPMRSPPCLFPASAAERMAAAMRAGAAPH